MPAAERIVARDLGSHTGQHFQPRLEHLAFNPKITSDARQQRDTHLGASSSHGDTKRAM
jgi:hypothetical protein